MSILQNQLRIGRFTSSEIFKLTKMDKSGKKFGVPAIKYIRQTKDELLLERSIDSEANARALSWGHICEPIVHEKLGLDYIFCSDETMQHPEIPYWSGSKDGLHEGEERAIVEYKAPFTKDSFCQLVRPLYQGFTGLEAMYAIRDGYDFEGFEYPAHTLGEQYYWQCVSNAEINKCDFTELIIYMPYDSELLEIGNAAKGNPSMNWMQFVGEDEIPSIKDGGYFKNLNIIRFKVPQADKDLLRECVLKAGEKLNIQPLQLAA